MRDLIRRKIIDALVEAIPKLTRRDVHIPAIADKAIAVIGMRRAGKTTLLWQTLQDRLAQGTQREGLLHFGFEDEHLAGAEGRFPICARRKDWEWTSWFATPKGAKS